eukprot:c41228_g1_i1.p1 GENE.c41228_g1_i1~~c41228_g1_i1.p1  ORF type:complete len:442 (-),score=100.32 c41228_g1_i1:317-1642(-)
MLWYVVALALGESAVPHSQSLPTLFPEESLNPPRPQLPSQYHANVTISDTWPFDARPPPPSAASKERPIFVRDSAKSFDQTKLRAMLTPIARKWSRAKSMDGTQGIMFVDRAAGKMTLSEKSDLSDLVPGGCVVNITEYMHQDKGYEWVNGACAVSDQLFTDIFAWVPDAKSVGPGRVNGVDCDMWIWGDAEGYFNATTCTRFNTPLAVYLSIMVDPHAAATQVSFVFDTFSPEAPPASALDPPSSCFTQAVCPTQGIQVLDMYIAHPNSTFEIANQNAANLLGDVFFTCFDVLTNGTQKDGYNVVSWYRVQVLAQWGQYMECNGHPPVCSGSTSFYVGRERGLACGDLRGACSKDSSNGFWYSLTADGQCQGAQTVESGVCSWKILERVKTITMECLFETQGMLGKCATGFLEAVPIFENAFQNSEISQGGCPDAPPPTA